MFIQKNMGQSHLSGNLKLNVDSINISKSFKGFGLDIKNDTLLQESIQKISLDTNRAKSFIGLLGNKVPSFIETKEDGARTKLTYFILTNGTHKKPAIEVNIGKFLKGEGFKSSFINSNIEMFKALITGNFDTIIRPGDGLWANSVGSAIDNINDDVLEITPSLIPLPLKQDKSFQKYKQTVENSAVLELLKFNRLITYLNYHIKELLGNDFNEKYFVIKVEDFDGKLGNITINESLIKSISKYTNKPENFSKITELVGREKLNNLVGEFLS